MPKLKLVYLVDDNDITQFISLKAMELTEKVEEVKCFKNGEDALKALLNNTTALPELILLDLHMPVMDGWEFIEQFDTLTIAVKEKIKLCILTSSLDTKEKEFLKSHSYIVDYVVKPITAKMFTSILSAINQF